MSDWKTPMRKVNDAYFRPNQNIWRLTLDCGHSIDRQEPPGPEGCVCLVCEMGAHMTPKPTETP